MINIPNKLDEMFFPYYAVGLFSFFDLIFEYLFNIFYKLATNEALYISIIKCSRGIFWVSVPEILK